MKGRGNRSRIPVLPASISRDPTRVFLRPGYFLRAGFTKPEGRARLLIISPIFDAS